MIIEIDLELIKEIGLTPNQYIYLHCKHKEHEYTVNGIQVPILINCKWLDEEGNIGPKWLDLFATDFDDLFKELLDVYPAIVESPGRGKRILHAKDPNAYTNMKAKNRYRKVTNEKVVKHREIMRLLHIQLETDKESLGYMQNLETWLNNYTWEKYVDINLEQNNDGRITRSL
jgi:hypothetical protein